jgi:protein-S-isoprenylcysteine O-methyltransferase Ste14
MTNPARLAIVASVALTAALGVLTLTHSPPRVVRASARGEDVLGSTTGVASACQGGEALPAGVSAVRIWLEAEFGPPVSVRAYARGRLLTQGRRGAGWTASAVTVPVKPLAHAAAGVKLCFDARPNGERLQLYGVHTDSRTAALGPGGQRLGGRMTVEYLAGGRSSWFSHALAVARRMGMGRAFAGTWIAPLVALVMAAVCALLVGTAWRELPAGHSQERSRPKARAAREESAGRTR